MYGHKRVRERRHDTLTRVGWEQLEVLLATWYQGQGYEVEHTGTGASGSKYDGGIDLKLRRPGEYLLVQVKHWNAYKVPHNDVHQLLGLMVNEGATGAILVTSGEFTKAAIEAATRHGHVRLIDGDELRAMLGPLPEPSSPGLVGRIASSPDARRIGNALGDRFLLELEGAIRGGRPSRYARRAVAVSFWLVVLKIIGALLLFWFFSYTLSNALKGITTPSPVAAPAPSAASLRARVVPRRITGSGSLIWSDKGLD